MKPYPAVLLAVALVTGCAPSADQGPADAATLALLGFDDPRIVQIIRSEADSVEVFATWDYRAGQLNIAGVAIPVAAETIELTLARLRAKLTGTGVGAYYSQQNLDRGFDRIAFVHTEDQFEFLGLAHTSGVNQDLDHADVAARLRDWDIRLGADILGAGEDWVTVRLAAPPSDPMAFAEEVYAFCPDVVDGGHQTVTDLAEAILASRSVHCWWS